MGAVAGAVVGAVVAGADAGTAAGAEAGSEAGAEPVVVAGGAAGIVTGGLLPSRVRNGENGVTSNGIFSAAELSVTGLVLINSSRSVQGSIRTRPPSGSAAI